MSALPRIAAPRRLIQPPGGTKTGPAIWTWSIPAGATCPGETPTCGADCYAKKYLFKVNSERHAWNLDQAEGPDFERRILAEITAGDIETIRLHVAGDFYSAAYVEKWARIARKAPRTRFVTYTRSWGDPAILPALKRFGRIPGVALWWSEDRDTGRSPRTPGIRTAFYVADQADADRVPAHADLVFRKLGARWEPRKRIGKTLICPAEQAIERQVTITCSTCGVCL